MKLFGGWFEEPVLTLRGILHGVPGEGPVRNNTDLSVGLHPAGGVLLLMLMLMLCFGSILHLYGCQWKTSVSVLTM